MAKTKHGRNWKTIVIPSDDYFELKAVAALEARKISQQFRVVLNDWLAARYNDSDRKRIAEVAEEIRLAQDGVDEQYISS